MSVIDFLHTGGVTYVLRVPRYMLGEVLDRLTDCEAHDASHVFVVDQSQANRIDGTVSVGVSEHGVDCVKDLDL